MKPKSALRWVMPFLRYGLCAVAIIYLYSKVNWYDRVRLAGEPEVWVRLIEHSGDQFIIERAGQRETITVEHVHQLRVGDQDVPEIEYGIPTVVAQTDKLWALWSIIIFFPVLMLQTGRLVVMLAIQGVRLSFWTSTKLTFAGNFFNFALPGTTGGDLIKAYYITYYTPLKTEAVTTVFLDRAIGLLGLVMLAGAAIALTRNPEQFRQLITTLVIICGCLGLGSLVVFSRRLRGALRLRELAARLPMGDQLLRVGGATVAMRHHKMLVVLSLLMTLVLQAIVMYSAFIMARAMGMKGDVSYYFIYISIGFLIAAIPISPPQAFGIMEAAYIQFFAMGSLGNDASQAVALALAVRLIQLVWALPGILVPLLGAHLPRKEELATLKDKTAAPAPTPK